MEETELLDSSYRSLSFWHDSLQESLSPRPISGRRNFDVLVLGAGYTGLWTALYLLRQKPDLKIGIIEKEIAGFGASGRNGGWCSALFPWSAELISQRYGKDQAIAIRKAMVATVDEIGSITRELGISCDFQKAGTINLVRNRAQLKRAESEIEQAKEFGVDQLGFLEPGLLPKASSAITAVFDPACASIQPAKLVRGLARKVEELGGEIFEKTEVLDFSSGLVRTTRGDFHGEYIVDALEGYRPLLPRRKREFLPLYSLMIVTEPISPELLDEIGLVQGITFADFRNLIIYGQRTKDNRIAFGGRGAPYHFGSSVKAEYDTVEKIHVFLEKELKDLFPQLKQVKITHNWGGALGVARDWMASVRLDSVTKIGQAGGYVGDGVGTSNLAGRTMADLILGKQSDLTALAFVNHRSPRWEVEPFRFIAARGAMLAARIADVMERSTGRQSFITSIIRFLTGKR